MHQIVIRCARTNSQLKDGINLTREEVVCEKEGILSSFIVLEELLKARIVLFVLISQHSQVIYKISVCHHNVGRVARH